jgi:outer membrane protein TolC
MGSQLPQRPDDAYGARILRGFGISATLTFAWNLLDAGGYRARENRAEIDRNRAIANETVTVRAARLAFQQAQLDLDTLARAIDVNLRAVAAARDAYLAADSVYRGGSGTALAVIDAHRVWVTAAIAQANAELRYGLAEAAYLRWSGR